MHTHTHTHNIMLFNISHLQEIKTCRDWSGSGVISHHTAAVYRRLVSTVFVDTITYQYHSLKEMLPSEVTEQDRGLSLPQILDLVQETRQSSLSTFPQENPFACISQHPLYCKNLNYFNLICMTINISICTCCKHANKATII